MHVRGALAAIAALVALAAVLVLAAPDGAHSLFGAGLILVLVASFVPFIPSGGLEQMYDRTLGFQVGRDSPFSVWLIALFLRYDTARA